MSRSVPEWIGKSDDTPAPPRVRLRVFERYNGKDYTTGQVIRAGDKWELEHVVAIINGGENRESNLAPILKSNHPAKTKADLAIKSKTARTRKKHLGIQKPKGTLKGRGFGYQPSNTRDIYEDLEQPNE